MVEKYLVGTAPYENIKNEIEKITPHQIEDNAIIIIEFRFLDDFCNSRNRNNKWSRTEISNRKSFLKPIKKDLNQQGFYYIAMFENGIKLKNKPNIESEYFFSDSNGYFRKKLFIVPALCGSFAAIKPNGEVLIRNGECRGDSFAQYLNPDNWSLFFNSDRP